MNTNPEDPRLGRFIPDDWTHVDNYPLSAVESKQRPVRVPVVLGVNWYEAFDNPEQDGDTAEFWVARGGADLGRIRGGHCVCLEPGDSADDASWWSFYDQGTEGACVGFGWSRCMSLLNKELYAARWLWDRAKEVDEWGETNPGDSEGTSVRAAGDILRAHGHVDWANAMADDEVSERTQYTASMDNGIQRFRWARSVSEVHEALGNTEADRLEAVPFLNSWGKSYPRRTWMPDAVLERLIGESGEIAVPVDRDGAAPPFPGRLLRFPPLTVGTDVSTWQSRMGAIGFSLVADGKYGPKSKAACTELQRNRGVAVDGIVGPDTWRETFL